MDIEYVDATEYREGSLKASRWIDLLTLGSHLDDFYYYVTGASQDYTLTFSEGVCTITNLTHGAYNDSSKAAHSLYRA